MPPLIPIYNIDAFDPDNDPLIHSISGTDASYFRIDSDDGEIRLINSADYESKSSYIFDATVSDGTLSDTKTVTVNVIDVNEAPTLTSSDTSTVEENASTDTVIYNIDAFDPDNDPLIHSISGTDASYFRIDSDDGEIRLINSADYESKSSYIFDATVSDGSLSDTKTVTVNVIDVNEAPTLTSSDTSTVEENASTDTVIYNIDAFDPDNDPLIHSIQELMPPISGSIVMMARSD